jgi:hypothetical protein
MIVRTLASVAGTIAALPQGAPTPGRQGADGLWLMGGT